MKHLLLACCVFILTAAGAALLYAGAIVPALQHPPLPVATTVAGMGMGALVAAVALAIPMRFGVAVEKLRDLPPAIGAVVKGSRGDGDRS